MSSGVERTEVAGKVIGASVLVSTKLRHGFAEDKDARGSWYGFGFILDRDRGWVVTNRHVAGVGDVQNFIEFADKEKRIEAERLYLDSKYDFAILTEPTLADFGKVLARRAS